MKLFFLLWMLRCHGHVLNNLLVQSGAEPNDTFWHNLHVQSGAEPNDTFWHNLLVQSGAEPNDTFWHNLLVQSGAEPNDTFWHTTIFYTTMKRWSSKHQFYLRSKQFITYLSLIIIITDKQTTLSLKGRAMAQAVSRRPLTTEARVRSEVKSMWDLWWTKWHWDRFFSELSVFPCRFQSTGAQLIVKLGKKNCSSSSSQGCTKSLRLWCVRSVSCGALHHPKEKNYALWDNP
jgi:hypothetical protein